MSRIVTLSEAVTIALHSMVLVARSEKVPVNVNRLSELTGASRNHIAKVMQRLVKVGFIKSSRGPNGGFVLKKDPDNIRLLEIYEAIEGDVLVGGCPFDKQICAFGQCIMGGIIHSMTQQFIKYFETHTLRDLMRN
jgi:Rrf2 family protein